MTTYAAFYNVHEGMKAQSIIESRRSSSSSNESSASQKSQKTFLKRAIEQLKPIEEAQTPAGIYTPIIKRGPLFAGLRPADKAQTPSPIYQRERPLFGSFSKSKRSSK